jgi:hypothetical protein
MPFILGKLKGVRGRHLYEVRMRTERPRFPPVCACCGDPTSETYRPFPPARPRGLPPPAVPFEIPLCSFCLRHWRARQAKNTLNLIAANVGVWGIALTLMAGGKGGVFLIGPVLAGLLFLAGQFRTRKGEILKETCTSRELPVRAIWERGEVYRYSFARGPFAEEVRRLNRDVLQEGGEGIR